MGSCSKKSVTRRLNRALRFAFFAPHNAENMPSDGCCIDNGSASRMTGSYGPVNSGTGWARGRTKRALALAAVAFFAGDVSRSARYRRLACINLVRFALINDEMLEKRARPSAL